MHKDCDHAGYDDDIFCQKCAAVRDNLGADWRESTEEEKERNIIICDISQKLRESRKLLGWKVGSFAKAEIVLYQPSKKITLIVTIAGEAIDD